MIHKISRFKILSPGGTSEVRGKRYFKLLQRSLPSLDCDLIKYFGGDFFHDGEMEPIQFSRTMNNCSLNISTNNILNHNKVQIGPIKFKCTFNNIAGMVISTERVNKYNDPLKSAQKSLKYLHSEVNTLSDEIDFYSKKNKREFCSIIIHAMPSYKSVGIIFESVHVDLVDPVGFKAAYGSQDLFFPFMKI